MIKIKLIFRSYPGADMTDRLIAKYGEGIYTEFFVMDDFENEKCSLYTGDIITIKSDLPIDSSIYSMNSSLDVENVGRAVMLSRYLGS